MQMVFADPTQIQDNKIYIGIVSSLVAFADMMIAKTSDSSDSKSHLGMFSYYDPLICKTWDWADMTWDSAQSCSGAGCVGALTEVSLKRIHSSSVAAWLTSTKHFKDLSNQTRASNDFELKHFLNCPPPHLICHKCRIFWQNVLKDSAFLLRASPSTTWTHHNVATSSLSIARPNPLRKYYKNLPEKQVKL